MAGNKANVNNDVDATARNQHLTPSVAVHPASSRGSSVGGSARSLDVNAVVERVVSGVSALSSAEPSDGEVGSSREGSRNRGGGGGVKAVV